MLRRNMPYGNIIYMFIQLKITRKWPEDLLFYRFILKKQTYEKGTTFQWKIHERGTFCQIVYIRVGDWTSGQSLSEQSFIE